MSALHPYSAYKAAGIPWLQHVPEHWDLIPNRGLVRKRKVLVGKRHKEYQLLSLTKQGIIVRDISTGKGKFSADMGTSQEVRKGDLVFCLFDVPETPRTVGLSNHDGMITGAYTVFDFIGRGSAEYFDYYYRALDDRKLLGPLYSGLRNTVPLDKLLVTKTPQPPVDEQHLIVRYLHALDAKVKRYIRTKRSLIARLQEQKQAIIQRAVTRGLNPNVKLKPSGVEWLGEVPEHWEVLALKRMLTRLIDCEHKTAPEVETSPFVVVRTSAVKRGVLELSGTYRTSEKAYQAWTRRGLPESGDVIFTREAPAGEACVVPSGLQLCLGQRTVLMKLRRDRYDPQFLVHMIYSGPPALRILLASQGSTVGHFNMSDIGDMLVFTPPLHEQQSILSSIATQTRPLDIASTDATQSIAHVQGYHTRLIADVVTGAVDVRAAAQALPEDQMIGGSEDRMMEESNEPLDEETIEQQG
jgi:type I restriction enzyme S subunit